MTLIKDVGQEQPIETLLYELQHRVDSVVSQVAIHAHDMAKHETHLTSQLAHAIYAAISYHPIEVKGLKLEVHVEEFQPLEEHTSGADLYIYIDCQKRRPRFDQQRHVGSVQTAGNVDRSDERRRYATSPRKCEGGPPKHPMSGSSRRTMVPEGLRSVIRRLSTPNAIGFEIVPDGSTSHMGWTDWIPENSSGTQL
jgi:hypothetical protein